MNNGIILFECHRHPGDLRLSNKSCANRWKIAQKNESRMQIGKSCEVGAKNAGEPLQPPQAKICCVRCGRSDMDAQKVEQFHQAILNRLKDRDRHLVGYILEDLERLNAEWANLNSFTRPGD